MAPSSSTISDGVAPKKKYSCRWTEEREQRLLLAIVEANKERGGTDWDRVQQLFDPNIKPGAITQHLAKVRNDRLKKLLDTPKTRNVRRKAVAPMPSDGTIAGGSFSSGNQKQSKKHTPAAKRTVARRASPLGDDGPGSDPDGEWGVKPPKAQRKNLRLIVPKRRRPQAVHQEEGRQSDGFEIDGVDTADEAEQQASDDDEEDDDIHKGHTEGNSGISATFQAGHGMPTGQDRRGMTIKHNRSRTPQFAGQVQVHSAPPVVPFGSMSPAGNMTNVRSTHPAAAYIPTTLSYAPYTAVGESAGLAATSGDFGDSTNFIPINGVFSNAAYTNDGLGPSMFSGYGNNTINPGYLTQGGTGDFLNGSGFYETMLNEESNENGLEAVFSDFVDDGAY